MSLTITTQPPQEPVTLEEVKDQLQIRYSNNRFDNLLESYIKAARQYCERYLGRTIIRTAYAYSFDRFPADKFALPKASVISVESITYFDTTTSPNIQTVSTDVYGVDTGVCPGLVYLKYGQTWPTSRGHHNDITVNFTAGYDDTVSSPRDYSDQVPENIKTAMKLIIGNLFLFREQRTDIQSYDNPTANIFLDLEQLRSVS